MISSSCWWFFIFQNTILVNNSFNGLNQRSHLWTFLVKFKSHQTSTCRSKTYENWCPDRCLSHLVTCHLMNPPTKKRIPLPCLSSFQAKQHTLVPCKTEEKWEAYLKREIISKSMEMKMKYTIIILGYITSIVL